MKNNEKQTLRKFERSFDELRKIKLVPHFAKHADGSCLVQFGDTHILCTASVDERVPHFLRGQMRGWITAEYGMLPRSTHTRMEREAQKGKLSGRTMEIQRLIGRSLRAVTDLTLLGERQIIIDDKATAEQKDALEKILSGEDTEDMATIAWVINAMTSTHHETLYKSISFEANIENRTGKVMVDDVFELNVEPIKNPVSGEPHRVRIDIPRGFEFTIAEMASGTVKTQGTIDLPNNNGTHSHMCELHWNNSGIIRD